MPLPSNPSVMSQLGRAAEAGAAGVMGSIQRAADATGVDFSYLVKTAQRDGDASALIRARQAVQAAKVALGERGPVWWTDGASDYNRYLVKNTPYAAWFSQLP